MPLPIDYVARKGDVLLVNAVVLYDQDTIDNNYLHVQVEGSHLKNAIAREDLDKAVHKLKIRAWHVGESVRSRDDVDVCGKVIAVTGEAVVVHLLGPSQKGAVAGVRVFHANQIEDLS
jgi:hypothetical protein